MIQFDRLSYTYPGAAVPVLRGLTLDIPDGEFLLVMGPSGAGKSTFLRCLNGLVPHFYGGTISGSVQVYGRNPIALAPRGMADLVGFVLQDPEAQFVVDRVEDELAFAMENQGVDPLVMRKRVEESLDQLGIAHLRGRSVHTLSGGERQRVAIAAVMTLQPRLLVLDEPTSQLDPQAAEEVLDTLVRLNHDLGLTIVLSEHRLERVVQYVDRILYLPGEGRPPLLDEPRAVLAKVDLVPPLIEVAKALQWTPLPLTIKEGRRFASQVGVARQPEASGAAPSSLLRAAAGTAQAARPGAPGEVSVSVQELAFSYNGRPALDGLSLEVRKGEFVALMGRNGAGKTTLLKQMVGLLKPHRGAVQLHGFGTPMLDTRSAPVEEIIRLVGYVPQNPQALLFGDTVRDELDFTRRGHGQPTGDYAALLSDLSLVSHAGSYPRDLSVGERQRVALAAILVAEPQILLLDEPTRGLDYEQKAALARLLSRLRAHGRTILMASHDVELVAQCADRVILLAEGRVVVDGPTRQVMSQSLVFASQVSKLFQGMGLLTVEDALASAGLARAA
ncbi:MAG TPA: ATP-binding cassette domain-containing protein [Anaerolineae bacterium]|nr:ATP-binding cassette domain-containing protein [Anaerolineae bacterium]